MFWHLLGLTTLSVIILTSFGTAVWAYVAAERPWYLRTRVRVPREPAPIEWSSDHDNPIPGV